jgi:hypothetical protein
MRGSETIAEWYYEGQDLVIVVTAGLCNVSGQRQGANGVVERPLAAAR